MKFYSTELGKTVFGKLTWLVEKFVCGLNFLEELHRFVLKKFCVSWYGESLFLWICVISQHKFIQHFFSTKFCPVFERFMPNYSELKYSLTNFVKKNQLDAQLILCIFRQPLHVSDVSRPIIRRENRMYTAIGTYYSFLSWLDWNNPTRTTNSHLKRIISTNCCIHTVVPPDDGPR